MLEFVIALVVLITLVVACANWIRLPLIDRDGNDGSGGTGHELLLRRRGGSISQQHHLTAGDTASVLAGSYRPTHSRKLSSSRSATVLTTPLSPGVLNQRRAFILSHVITPRVLFADVLPGSSTIDDAAFFGSSVLERTPRGVAASWFTSGTVAGVPSSAASRLPLPLPLPMGSSPFTSSAFHGQPSASSTASSSTGSGSSFAAAFQLPTAGNTTTTTNTTNNIGTGGGVLSFASSSSFLTHSTSSSNGSNASSTSSSSSSSSAVSVGFSARFASELANSDAVTATSRGSYLGLGIEESHEHAAPDCARAAPTFASGTALPDSRDSALISSDGSLPDENAEGNRPSTSYSRIEHRSSADEPPDEQTLATISRSTPPLHQVLAQMHSSTTAAAAKGGSNTKSRDRAGNDDEDDDDDDDGDDDDDDGGHLGTAAPDLSGYDLALGSPVMAVDEALPDADRSEAAAPQQAHHTSAHPPPHHAPPPHHHQDSSAITTTNTTTTTTASGGSATSRRQKRSILPVQQLRRSERQSKKRALSPDAPGYQPPVPPTTPSSASAPMPRRQGLHTHETASSQDAEQRTGADATNATNASSTSTTTGPTKISLSALLAQEIDDEDDTDLAFLTAPDRDERGSTQEANSSISERRKLAYMRVSNSWDADMARAGEQSLSYGTRTRGSSVSSEPSPPLPFTSTSNKKSKEAYQQAILDAYSTRLDEITKREAIASVPPSIRALIQNKASTVSMKESGTYVGERTLFEPSNTTLPPPPPPPLQRTNHSPEFQVTSTTSTTQPSSGAAPSLASAQSIPTNRSKQHQHQQPPTGTNKEHTQDELVGDELSSATAAAAVASSSSSSSSSSNASTDERGAPITWNQGRESDLEIKKKSYRNCFQKSTTSVTLDSSTNIAASTANSSITSDDSDFFSVMSQQPDRGHTYTGGFGLKLGDDDELDDHILDGVDLHDWNERFQRILSTIRRFDNNTPASKQIRANRALIQLARDFIYASSTYGKIIISEAYSADKTIKPLPLGGMMGGQKYIVQSTCSCCSLSVERSSSVSILLTHSLAAIHLITQS